MLMLHDYYCGWCLRDYKLAKDPLIPAWYCPLCGHSELVEEEEGEE